MSLLFQIVEDINKPKRIFRRVCPFTGNNSLPLFKLPPSKKARHDYRKSIEALNALHNIPVTSSERESMSDNTRPSVIVSASDKQTTISSSQSEEPTENNHRQEPHESPRDGEAVGSLVDDRSVSCRTDLDISGSSDQVHRRDSAGINRGEPPGIYDKINHDASKICGDTQLRHDITLNGSIPLEPKAPNIASHTTIRGALLGPRMTSEGLISREPLGHSVESMISNTTSSHIWKSAEPIQQIQDNCLHSEGIRHEPLAHSIESMVSTRRKPPTQTNVSDNSIAEATMGDTISSNRVNFVHNVPDRHRKAGGSHDRVDDTVMREHIKVLHAKPSLPAMIVQSREMVI